MTVLWGFSIPVIQTFGYVNYLGFYLGACISSSIFTIMRQSFFKRNRISLGASGNIYGIIGTFLILKSEGFCNFIFLPLFKFKVRYVFLLFLFIDIFGILRQWKFFDHSAHVGGFTIGFGLCLWKIYQTNATFPDGIKLADNKTIYIGPIKNYLAIGPGLVFNPKWTYNGYLSENEILEGIAQFRSEIIGWIWTGIFLKGKISDLGYVLQKNSKKNLIAYFLNGKFNGIT